MTEIGDLALLSTGATAALVGRDGSVDWWPGPRFDGPSVFGRVLDPEAGHFSVRPAAPGAVQRTYVPGTMVLVTEHRAASGVLRVTDCLALAPGARGHGIGLRSPDALVRLIEAVGGEVEVAVELAPRPEYGLVVPRLVREGGMLATVGGARTGSTSRARRGSRSMAPPRPLDAADERMLATYDAIERELGEEGLIRRTADAPARRSSARWPSPMTSGC